MHKKVRRRGRSAVEGRKRKLTMGMREATAYHEAGHVVAAWRQGLKFHRVTIIPTAHFDGSVVHDNPLRGVRLEYDNTSDRARFGAEKAMLVCLAGPAA